MNYYRSLLHLSRACNGAPTCEDDLDLYWLGFTSSLAGLFVLSMFVINFYLINIKMKHFFFLTLLALAYCVKITPRIRNIVINGDAGSAAHFAAQIETEATASISSSLLVIAGLLALLNISIIIGVFLWNKRTQGKKEEEL